LEHWKRQGLDQDSADNEARADLMNSLRGGNAYTASYFASLQANARRLQSDKESLASVLSRREQGDLEKEQQAVIASATKTGMEVLRDIETAVLKGMTKSQRLHALKPENKDTYLDTIRQASQQRLAKAYREWIRETHGKPKSEWFYSGDGTPRGVTDLEIREYSTIVPYFKFMRKGLELGIDQELMPTLFERMKYEPPPTLSGANR
jgi:hypothetical protein